MRDLAAADDTHQDTLRTAASNATRFRRALTLVLVAFAAVAGVLAGAVPSAVAADNTATTSNEIDLRTTFSVTSNTAAADQYIPIPVGLTPTEVSGNLIPDIQTGGRVVFLTHNRVVATYPISTTTSSLPVTVPVDASDIDENGYLVFAIRFLTDGVTDKALICVTSDYGTVQFADVKVRVTGRERPPSTIAQFFSASVREVSVVIPEDPSPELQEAGLAAVAALAHRYPTLDTEITLSTEQHTERAADVQAIGGRLIEFVPGEGEAVARVGLRDGVRLLTITGDPSKLTDAANALGSADLATVDATSTTSLEASGHDAPQTVLTLKDLGTDGVHLSGIGTSKVEVPVSQTAFASSVASFQVHLVGVRSQVPDYIAAMLSVYWDGNLITSEVFDDNTTIDKTIDIPGTRVERDNVLTFRLDAIPNSSGGSGSGSSSSGEPSVNSGVDCGGAFGILPIEVFIDGTASTVTATPGQTLAAGFARFPQMLGNVLAVAIGSDTLLSDSVSDAGLLVCALQRASSHQFDVELESPQDFIKGSASGLIVGADSQEIDDLGAPLRMGEFRTIDSADAHFGAGVQSPYAALQAFTSGGRGVLSLSSWGPYQPGALVGRQLQSSLAEYIAGDKGGGWSGLYDDLLIAQRDDADPVFLASDAVVPQASRIDDYNPILLWVAVGLASLLVLAGAGFIARLWVRRRARRVVAAEAQFAAAEDDERRRR